MILGSVLGLTPVFALHNLLVILLICIIKVNAAAAVFSSILFGVIGFFIDPLAHFAGEKVLLAGALEGTWTAMYNTPVIALTRFNNTVVMGTLLISLVAALPLYAATVKFVVYYRESLKDRVDKLKVVKLMKASKIYKIYRRFSP